MNSLQKSDDIEAYREENSRGTLTSTYYNNGMPRRINEFAGALNIIMCGAGGFGLGTTADLIINVIVYTNEQNVLTHRSAMLGVIGGVIGLSIAFFLEISRARRI